MHLEDSPDDVEFVKRELKKGGLSFDFLSVDDREAFAEALVTFKPDIILSDHSLAGFDSLEALQIVRSKGLSTPFILVTATVAEWFAVTVLKSGAEDYILKDRLQRLPNAVVSALRKQQHEKEAAQHQEEIFRNEKKFRALIENTNDLIGLFDGHFQMIYRSPNYYRFTGWSSEELENIGVLSGIHPQDFPASQLIMQQVLSNPGKSFHVNYRFLHKLGHYIWLDGIVTNMLHDESIKGIVSNMRDVTEERQAESAHRAAHDRLLFHMENSPLGFIEWDSQFRMISCSKRAEEIFGWSDQEYRHTEINGLATIYVEDQERTTQVANELTTGKVERNHALNRNVRKDGTVIWCEWFNSVLKNAAGEVITIMSLVQDVTERKKTEEKIVQSESRFRGLLENSYDAIVIRDAQFHMIYSSPSARRILGINETDPAEVSFIDTIHPDDRTFVDNIQQEILNNPGRPYFLTFRKKHMKGHYVWVEGVMTNMLHNPAIEGIVSNFRDITERHESEEEKNKLVAQLIEQNNDLTQFSFIASHNLRGPVASMLGLVQLLDNAHKQEEYAMVRQHMKTSAQKLDSVITDLSEIVEVKTSGEHLKETVSIPEIIGELQQFFESEKAQ